MFMHKSKKGFTIVELVIVIAVIAILAAVLIPTFSNLVKKANIASDTSLAKNINTALTAYDATNGVEEFSDVIAAAKEAGYIISNLNPTTEGCYFVWESSTNQILLVDSNDGYKVIYANNEKYATAGNTWYFAVRTQAEADTITAALTGVNAKLAISKTSTLNAEINVAGEKTIYIDGGLEVDSENTIKLDNADAKITIDLGSSEVTGGSADSALAAIPFEINAGELTLKKGIVEATGRMIDSDGDTNDIPLSTEGNTFTKIEGTTFNITTNNEGFLFFKGDGELKDVNINSTNVGITLNGNAQVVLDDTTINAKQCFFVSTYLDEGDYSGNAKLTINSGEYASEWAPVQLYAGAEVVINGGTFTRESNKAMMLFLSPINESTSKITIKGGTFVRGGVTYKYEDLNASVLQQLILNDKDTSQKVKVTGSTAAGWVITSK